MQRIEGSGASQLVQLIRAIGHNADVSIELATVTAAPPELKIKVDHMNVELEKDDLVVAQSLTKHKRKINLKSEGGTKVSAKNEVPAAPTGFKVGFTLVSAHGDQLMFASLDLSSADQTIEEAELEFTDELKEGDRVLVAGIQQGQTYIILDRAVMY
ncbi:DUF2577 domain-containing protein [Paenibacillus arenilitoris]|uniref:DUF2577 domain-containing protein n=1 Tax=Paenibacillus arenilitoris TaxID=2772299 RepID=A0A927H3V0_9BACL|nr:DUF2577 domain-containing protein [Paenibacillus arenilitoris]MBD2867736.1 DUF2577 domain-containing protein [Paenibacillus arenilitoris]